MIGDRSHDMRGAVAVGVRSIGVLWGYGDDAELTAAGADALAATPAALLGQLTA
jgi:phosphoglycolate phosphatase